MSAEIDRSHLVATPGSSDRLTLLDALVQLSGAPFSKCSKAGANRPTAPKGKARDPLEITGLLWLREPDLN